jgi:hypothetical protein
LHSQNERNGLSPLFWKREKQNTNTTSQQQVVTVKLPAGFGQRSLKSSLNNEKIRIANRISA